MTRRSHLHENAPPEEPARRRFLTSIALGATSLAQARCAGSAQRPPHGTLTTLLQAEPEHLDPRFPGDAVGAALSRLVYASLIDADPQTFEPRLALAERVEATDARTVRAVLREGLRFHDGTALTARDVAATFASVLDPAFRSPLRGSYLRTFAGVHLRDERTVDFELTGPDGTYPSLLQLGVMRERDAQSPIELVAQTGAEARFVGAGAARARSLSRGTWEFETTHPRPGAPSALRFLTMRDPNTLALRLLHGDADVAELKPELLPLFAQRPGFILASARSVGFTYLGLRNDHPLFASRPARVAVAQAIDVEALRRSKFGDHAVRALGPVAPSHWAYEPGLRATPYDPTRAHAQLREATRALGTRPVFRVSSVRFTLTLARAIARMLADVGLEVDVRPSDLATLLADLRAGRFDLTLLTMPDLSDPWGVSWLFSSSARPTPRDPRAGGNRWRYSNATLDEALDAGRRALGPEARRPHYARAQRILAEDLPVIPLWHPNVVFAAGPRVRALQPRGDAQYGFLLDATLRDAPTR